jgi:hypothetical protein
VDHIQHIDAYHMIRPLGDGGAGEVWKVSKNGEFFALKRYKSGYFHGGGKEWRHLRQLAHPNIVRGIEVGAWNGQAYLVMEYVEGKPLNEVSAHSLPREMQEEVARQLAAAISFAHGKGIIHRDLKPQNILLTPAGQVKALDFGVAAPLTYDLKARLMEGSYHFMAPEQLAGRINYQNDIWAFGVTLYTWLTSCHPYPAETLEALSLKLLTLEAPFAHHQEKRVSHKLSFILNKCLQRDLGKRYQNFSEILEDLNGDPVAPLRGQFSGRDLPEEMPSRQDESLEADISRQIRKKGWVFMAWLLLYVPFPYPIRDALKMDFAFDWPNIHLLALGIITIWIFASLFSMLKKSLLPEAGFPFIETGKQEALRFFASRETVLKVYFQFSGLYDLSLFNGLVLQDFQERGRTKGIREFTQMILDKDPNAPEALAYRIAESVKNEDWEQGRQLLQQLLLINPNDGAAQLLEKLLPVKIEQEPSSTVPALQQTLHRGSRTSKPSELPLSWIEKAIAEQGSVQLPVTLDFENFIFLPTPGALTLHEHFMTIRTEGGPLTAQHFYQWEKRQKLRRIRHKGRQIGKGKLLYYSYKYSNPLVKDTPMPGVAGLLASGLRSLVKQQQRFQQEAKREKGREELAGAFTISYDDLNRVALGGKLLECGSVGLLGLSFPHPTHQAAFLDWIRKRKESLSSSLIWLAIAGDKLFGFVIAMAILLAVAYFPNRKFWRSFIPNLKWDLIIGYKSLRHLISPKKNGDWILKKEADPYLECFRLLFQHSLVFPETEKPAALPVSDRVLVPPFEFDFDARQLHVAGKTLPFEAIRQVLLEGSGLIILDDSSVWHTQPLKSKQFAGYIPYLLQAAGDKVSLAENFFYDAK